MMTSKTGLSEELVCAGVPCGAPGGSGGEASRRADRAQHHRQQQGLWRRGAGAARRRGKQHDNFPQVLGHPGLHLLHRHSLCHDCLVSEITNLTCSAVVMMVRNVHARLLPSCNRRKHQSSASLLIRDCLRVVKCKMSFGLESADFRRHAVLSRRECCTYTEGLCSRRRCRQSRAAAAAPSRGTWCWRTTRSTRSSGASLSAAWRLPGRCPARREATPTSPLVTTSSGTPLRCRCL